MVSKSGLGTTLTAFFPQNQGDSLSSHGPAAAFLVSPIGLRHGGSEEVREWGDEGGGQSEGRPREPPAQDQLRDGKEVCWGVEDSGVSRGSGLTR